MSEGESRKNLSTEDQKRLAYYEAGQWTLVRRRFNKHRVAVWMLWVIAILYVLCMNCEFFAPHDPGTIDSRFVNMPPQIVRVGPTDGLYVHPAIMKIDPATLQRQYMPDTSRRVPLQFFVRGRTWKFLGLWETDLHFFGVDTAGGQTCYLLGTDGLGRDVFSRILYGGRVSLSIGFIGMAISFVLGISLGGVSGYFGGRIDMLIQRFAEILQTVPKIPIWLTMAAAIPREWSSLQVYFIMTLILACMGWTGLCRTVRGKLLALREEDYARAAQLAGASEPRVIFLHLVPNFMSHLIASLTLAIPGMILAETSLSFLGLGLRPPTVSWGVLLQQASKPHVVADHPWLLLPAGMVVMAVLAFNFIGEGLRDAADPYAV
jgi:peptide/nickel transport system permease protein